jgi:hypothetical protein
MTRGTWLLLCAAILRLMMVASDQSPAEAIDEAPRNLSQEPGFRAGTLELGVGSSVFCSAHPDLGPGTILEVRNTALVVFELRTLDVDLAEIENEEPTDPEDGPADELARLPEQRAPGDMLSTVRGFDLLEGVICPKHPELGAGTIARFWKAFVVKYASGVRTQTDREVRPARRSLPAQSSDAGFEAD